MELNNKFEIGQELYTVIRKPIEYKCPVCDGTGKFNHNGYEVKCPHCQGSGRIEDKKTLWNVVDHKVKVSSIKASIYKENQHIKYKVYCQSVININKRPEEQLFTSIEEAERFCYDNNHPVEQIIE